MNKYILIDLEWTLFNSQTINEDILPYVLKDMSDFVSGNFAQLAESQEGFAATSPRELVDIFQTWANGEISNSVLKAFSEKFMESNKTLKVKAFLDISQNLRDWSERGFTILAISRWPIAFQRLLLRNCDCGDLDTYFNDHYESTKTREGLSRTLKLIGKEYDAEPVEIIYISSSKKDIAIAQGLGLNVKLINRESSFDFAQHPN